MPNILKLHINKRSIMRKNIFSYIAAGAVAFTVVCLPLATSTSAIDCDDVKFIFARGSGQKLEDEDYLVYKAAIKTELLRQKSNLKVGYYELGSSSQNDAKYPAVALDFFTILGSKISSGQAFSFGESVNEGIAELKNYTETISASCPHTKYVIAGFSQGAMVITNGLKDLNPDKFIYAATFGDPKLYLPEGRGIIPPACLGKNLSPYRIFAPNCRTYAGSLNAKKPYTSDGWEKKVGLWCKDKDLVCGAGLKFSTPRNYTNILEQIIQSALASHTRYTIDGIYTAAAKTIVEKVRQVYPKAFLTNATITSGNRDTVILIDDTGSMAPYIEKYKTEAKRLAEETLKDGGRIALYAYGDLNDHKAIRLVDFGSTLNEFNDALETISALDGLGGDIPESFYAAVLDVLNQQEWRAGATKSIIVLTDAPALNPDRNGVTKEEVIARTIEIDPVNVYVVSDDPDAIDSYRDFTLSTSGKIFDTIDTGSTDYLLIRPSAEFPLAEYVGKPNDEFSFTVKTTGEIIKYEWDLDFDGVFEAETTIPTATMSYSSNASGFVQVKVTDKNNLTSSASAKVDISSTEPILPTLQNLKVTQKGTSISISYDLGENTIGSIISLDDAMLGFSDQNNLEITDIIKNTTLTLTPISADGLPGNPITGEIVFEKPSNILTPKTGTK